VSTGRLFIFSTVFHFEVRIASVTPQRRFEDLTRIVFHSQGRVAVFFASVERLVSSGLFLEESLALPQVTSSWITNFGVDSKNHESIRKGGPAWRPDRLALVP
jgi:hypothetical protein